MKEVAQAEKTLNTLRDKREMLVACGVELGEERTRLAFAAHAGDDPKARARLDEINREAALHDSELRSLDAAIAEAAVRVERAQRAEAQAADKASALALRKTVNEIGECMHYADTHLDKAIVALNAVHTALDQIHASGSDFPTHMQFAANAERALK
jgi:predicted translin family RNA/ssDNA-binding protein